MFILEKLVAPVKPSTLINPWNQTLDFEVLPWTREDFESLWYQAGFLLYKKRPVWREPNDYYWTTTSRKIGGIAGISCFAWLTSPFWNFWLRIHILVLMVNLPFSRGLSQRNPVATPYATVDEHSMIWLMTRESPILGGPILMCTGER